MLEVVGSTESGGFKDGYIGATDDTHLPHSATPRALNTAFSPGGGPPRLGTRKGCAVAYTATSGNAPITAFGVLPSVTVNQTPATPDDGSGVSLAYDPISYESAVLYATASEVGYFGAAAPVTIGSFTFARRPTFAVLNNTAYLTGGSEYQRKVRRDGAALYLERWGVQRPDVGTLAATASVAGLHNGTYELRVTFYNALGHESSASDTALATVTAANQALAWTNIPVASDTQVTGRYLYARNTDTQTQFYRVGTITNNVDTTATTSVEDSLALTVAPTTTSNGLPPSSAVSAAVYRNRLFVIGTDSVLRWSHLGKPEGFDDTNYVKVGDDLDASVGIYAEFDRLVIVKRNSTWVLSGEVGASYAIDLVDAEVGCAAIQTMVSAGGRLLWWSQHGLVSWDGAGAVQRIGQATYGPNDEVVNAGYMETVASAAVDSVRGSVYMAVPAPGQTRATRIVPYSYLRNAFEAAYWDPMDVSALGVDTTTTPPRVLMGNYAGQTLVLGTGYNDGIRSGTTHTGTFVAGATSLTSITDAGATFDTTDAGLKERKVSIFAADGTLVTTEARPRITSNTGTSVTVTPTVYGLEVGATYTYVIGGPDMQLDTPWLAFGDSFRNKRYEFAHLLTKGAATGVPASITLNFDYQLTDGASKQKVLTLAVSSGLWDSATWDTDLWDATTNRVTKRHVGRVGHVWRARLRNGNADQPLGLIELGLSAIGQNHRG